jgi:hypothetical protein
MVKNTVRDKIWNEALHQALSGGKLTESRLAELVDSNERTVGDCLRTMENMDWLDSDGGEGKEKKEYVGGERLPPTLGSVRSPDSSGADDSDGDEGWS